MGHQQSLNERAIRIESKLSRYIEEQEARNRRIDKMLDEWDQFKREWDEEGLDGEDTGFDHRDAAPVPARYAQQQLASG